MNNKGIGLVEILISLTLSCFIIILLQRHYLSVRQQYIYIKSALERNIEVKLASLLLRKSIREAGFTPCLGVENLSTIDDRNHKALRALNITDSGSLDSAENRSNWGLEWDSLYLNIVDLILCIICEAFDSMVISVSLLNINRYADSSCTTFTSFEAAINSSR